MKRSTCRSLRDVITITGERKGRGCSKQTPSHHFRHVEVLGKSVSKPPQVQCAFISRGFIQKYWRSTV